MTATPYPQGTPPIEPGRPPTSLDDRIAAVLSDDDSDSIAALTGRYAPSVLDEDDFTSDSATNPPSQQSTKAYVDAIAPTRIERIVAAGGETTVSFTGIPQNFDAVEVHFAADGASNNGVVSLRLNNDSGTNYDWVRNAAVITSTSPSFGASGDEADDRVELGSSHNDGITCRVVIPLYAGTTVRKAGEFATLEHRTPGWSYRGAFAWRSTAAVTRIDITASFVGGFAAGSIFTLVGVGGERPS